MLRSGVPWKVRPLSALSMAHLRFAGTHRSSMILPSALTRKCEMPGSLRSLGISHFRELTKEPPALISRGNINSATLRWRFPCRGGGERYGLARLRSLAVPMIGRAHRSKPPQSPTTTPVGGWLPPVSPPPATAPHPCYIWSYLRFLGS
mgnify:CR=1 FL=1